MQKLFEFVEHIGDWRVLVQSRDIGGGAIQSRHIADKAIDRSKMTDELINELRQVDVVDLLLGGVLDEYYTKEEIDVLLQELELDDYAKKEWVESKGYLTSRDISGKADKSDTYTKTQVISLVEALKKLDIVPVESIDKLPEASEETRRKLWFVKKTAGENTIKVETTQTVEVTTSGDNSGETSETETTETPVGETAGTETTQEENTQEGETQQGETTESETPSEETPQEETPTEEIPTEGTSSEEAPSEEGNAENAHDVYVTVVNTTYPEVEDDWKNVINLGNIHESRYEKIIKDLGVGTYIFNVLGTIKGTAYIYKVTPLSMTYDEPTIPERVAVGQMAMNRDGKYYQVCEDGRWKEFIPASTYEWLCIGTTHINFNDYYTKEEVDSLFAKKVELIEVANAQEELPIDPNKFYKLTNPVGYKLSVILNAPTETGIVNEYMLEFKVADGFEWECAGIRWIDGEAPDWEVGSTYQVSILNGLAVAAGWEAAG